MYWLGLDSGFILDDSANLYALGDITIGEISILDFVSNGQAGPGGRPISLFSFAIQHASWPDQPQFFKFVNLFIHLMNMVFLFFIAKIIGGYLGLSVKQGLAVASVATLWWGIHPLHMSSVLYVIQRMNLLSHFFILATLLAYLNMRKRMIGGESFFAFMLLGTTVLIGIIFAVLSKENGVLIPAFLLAIEFSFFYHHANRRQVVYWRLVRWVILAMPLLFLVGYLIWTRQSMMDAYAHRDFTMSERVLTQSRVLWMYVQSIFFPISGQYGVVHDNVTISHSLFNPISTLFSVLSWIVIVVLAVVLGVVQKRYVVLSFAVFFFLAGHVLESTVIPLELYFEHRNYLASFGLIYALCWLLWLESKALSSLLNGLKKGLLICLIAIFSLVSVDVARLWANPTEQAFAWAMQSPDSLRANQYLFGVISKGGQRELANKLNEKMMLNWPKAGLSYIRKIRYLCNAPDSSLDREISTQTELMEKIASAKITRWELRELKGFIIKENGQGGCQGLPESTILALFDALTESLSQAAGTNENDDRTVATRIELYELVGRYYFSEGRYHEAIEAWQQSFHQKPSAMIAYFMAYSFHKVGERDKASNSLRAAKEQLKTDAAGYDRKMRKLEALEVLLKGSAL